ncbi:MAG: hypothetical protein K2R98_34230 [Gemmataceae bacterium]|nr:hypothetical protein [Gemmataceae bacterium]
MTLREFLLKNAPREEMRRRQSREEWIVAVDRLLAQLRTWLADSQTAELLDLEPLAFEKREQFLGTYHIKGLAIHFGERTVKVVPVGRAVLAHLGPYAEPGHENAEGRVDITNGAYKYLVYRKLNDAAEEQWLVQDERSDIRPLDREQFEAILQALLS